MTGILDHVERELRDFRPRTHREFVALQICQRFDDLLNLVRYLQVCQQHPKRVLLEAARLAMVRGTPDGRPVTELFFELLRQFGQEGT
jgi:hypothetical protein